MLEAGHGMTLNAVPQPGYCGKLAISQIAAKDCGAVKIARRAETYVGTALRVRAVLSSKGMEDSFFPLSAR